MLRKTLRNLKGIGNVFLVAVNTIFWFIPVFVLAIVKLILPRGRVRRALTRWIMKLGEFWASGNAKVVEFANPIPWDVRGLDELARDQWYLVIANHQTAVDIVVLQTVFNRRIPFLKFFIKQELVWFPVLGIAWWAMDMPFMKRYSKSYLARHPEKKGKDLEATRAACRKFRHTPTSVINFIEGTRFTEEKKIRRGSPYEYLLPPRAGGIALALTSMGSMFDAVLDVTIVYPDGAPPFWSFCCGETDRIVVDIARRPVEHWMFTGDYANDRDFRRDFHQWLTGVWSEKDATIGTLIAENSEPERHMA